MDISVSGSILTTVLAVKTDPDTLPGLSIERMSINSLLFYLAFYLSPSSHSLPPPSVGVLLLLQCGFLQYYQSFHCDLWTVTRENNASYCFG